MEIIFQTVFCIARMRDLFQRHLLNLCIKYLFILYMETFKKISGSEFYRKFIVHGVHPDGRSIQKIRKTSVTTGKIS